MNINHLKYIKAVSELKNFSAAAATCNVTQSTLSNGVSRLEEELGQKIFERSTRTVKLTPFGRKILSSIKSMLDLEDAIYLISKEFKDPKTQIIKIGVSPLLNSKFISLLTKTFTENNKDQKVLLVEQNLNVLEKDFSSSDLDIIFIPQLNKAKTRNSMHLYKEELVYLESGLNKGQSVNVSDIKNKTFLMVPDTCGLSYAVRNLLGTTKKKIKEYEGLAMSYPVLAEWASNGLGSAILPVSKIPYGVHSSKIVSPTKSTEINFIAMWKSSDLPKLRPIVQHFKKNSSGIYKGLSA